MPGRREFAASNVFLTLDDVKCGPVKAAEGGFVSGDVVTDAGGSGSGDIVKKRIGAVRYEPFVIEVGLSMKAPVYDWVAATWKGEAVRKSGSLAVADFKLEAKRERQFVNALLTETTFPVFDASAKDAGFLQLKFQPELTSEKSAAGKQDGADAKAKQWLRSNFRLQIDGLDCTKVSKIESLTVKRLLKSNELGEGISADFVPGPLAFPDLQITLSEVSAKTWLDWHSDFVINGKNDKASERNGTIQLLAPDAKTELARIKLFGLGIYRIATAPVDARGDKINRLTAELYCERMELVVKP
jgi:hypothetical protein